jgi:alpha-galactosidase
MARPLKDKSLAVALFNRGEQAADIPVNWESLGIAGKKRRVCDLWKHQNVQVSGDKYTASVPSHGVVLLKVTAR